MKKIVFFVLPILILANHHLFATEKHDLKPYVGSAEFEPLKGLAGIWKGTSTEDDGTKFDANVESYVTSDGSAVVEKLFTGTPHEMISVYHDKNGKSSMTHYCAIGNQPEMDLLSSNEKEMKFDFSPSNSIDPAKDDHMHSLKLSFDGNDKLVQNWKYYKGGTEAGGTTMTLTRQ